MTDARFEDARETPLNLGAIDADDLKIIATLVQDAVFPVTEMAWNRAEGRFALLLNRFRWEEPVKGHLQPERVQSVLAVDCTKNVATSGIDRHDADLILSILTLSFEETDAPSGHLLITLAGDGAIRLAIEAIDVTLKDVTRPYAAPSGHTPRHED